MRGKEQRGKEKERESVRRYRKKQRRKYGSYLPTCISRTSF